MFDVETLLLIAPIAGFSSVIYAVYMFHYVNRKSAGSKRMREIADAIREGAKAYLRRQNMTLGIFVAIMATIMGVALFAANGNPADAFAASLSYVFGSVCTTAAMYLGMNTAVRANVRTANAARKGLSNAFPIAFFGGSVMGFSIVGLSLLGISILYLIFGNPEIVLYFSFGASALALFAKAGGGIYTKTADIGADLVGKVELGIPEDDPRNPAVIADNVGDNVGDVAGMGADLTDSYIAAVVAAMILGYAISGPFREIYVMLPILVAAIGIFASLLGTLFVRVREGGDPGAALNRGTYATCIFFAILLFVLINMLNLGKQGWGVLLATLAGLAAGVIIGITTDYFTSINRPPAIKTAMASQTGAAINILTGFSYGVLSIIPPIIGIAVATIVSWYAASFFEVSPIYGVSIAAVGMLAMVSMIISSDAYGPIADNAKGIAEQSGLGENVVAIADKLDAAGNTSKAITKGFAIGAAALTVLSLLAAYNEIVGLEMIDVTKPTVISGMFIGAMMPPVISALLVLAVGKNAFRMVEEIRRQFKEIPGLIDGKAKPDYAKCVDIAAKGALKELMKTCLPAIIAPIATGLILGKEALGGFLAGSIMTGIIFAIFMANSGGLWDNAKKYIEEGKFGGKGSDAHKAAVIGDTVGDPFKDTAGPTLNTMITVMSLVSSVFAPLIAQISLFSLLGL